MDFKSTGTRHMCPAHCILWRGSRSGEREIGGAKKQQLIPPETNKLVNFEIEVAFGYTGNDGSQCIGWYSGVVKQVLNINKKTVKIEWDEDCLGDMDARVSVHQLLPNNWNPKVAKNGGWRQHFKEYSVQ